MALRKQFTEAPREPPAPSSSPPRFVEEQVRSILARYPKHLREGPWSPCAYLIPAMAVLTLLALPAALATYERSPPPALEWVSLRAALLAHMLAISRQMLGCGIPMMLGTYTMCSWHLTVLHLACVLLPLPAVCQDLAQVLLFPMVFTSLITVVIWWGCVVPMAGVWCTKEQRALAIHYFSTNWAHAWGMINVHGFNAVFAVFEAWVSWRRLTYFDLWVGVAYSVAYGLFYMLVLDPRGLHYYVAMSPRPHWCGLTYSAVPLGVAGMFLLLQGL